MRIWFQLQEKKASATEEQSAESASIMKHFANTIPNSTPTQSVKDVLTAAASKGQFKSSAEIFSHFPSEPSPSKPRATREGSQPSDYTYCTYLTPCILCEKALLMRESIAMTDNEAVKVLMAAVMSGHFRMATAEKAIRHERLRMCYDHVDFVVSCSVFFSK